MAASVEAMRAEITRLEQNGDELRAAARAEAAAARDAAVAAMEAALTTVSVIRHTTLLCRFLLTGAKKKAVGLIAKLIECCSDGDEDQGAEEAFMGPRDNRVSSVLEAVSF